MHSKLVSLVRPARFLLTAGLLLGASTSALAQPTLIRDVRVFDGEEAHVQRSVLIDGNRIVEDDFQLICFDFVSEPSTVGAFMMKEHKEPNVFTKADKVNRILNDILSEK